MPKSGKNKYYAVSVGRGGPGIYRTWDEVRLAVTFRHCRPNLDFV
jgi:viroplasmin and RNaseH domain-containing protein